MKFGAKLLHLMPVGLSPKEGLAWFLDSFHHFPSYSFVFNDRIKPHMHNLGHLCYKSIVCTLKLLWNYSKYRHFYNSDTLPDYQTSCPVTRQAFHGFWMPLCITEQPPILTKEVISVVDPGGDPKTGPPAL